MPKVIQTQPEPVTERTALLKPSSSSSISTIASIGSLSELSNLSSTSECEIRRHKERICCNFSRKFCVHDHSDGRKELLYTAKQEYGCCSETYEDMIISDMQDQLMFTIEFDEATGYFSSQMKFSVISSAKLCIGTIVRVWSFMESPRYEIRNWDDEHLFSIGPPTTSGIKSYDFQIKYDVISNDGKLVSTLIQEGNCSISLKFDLVEPLHLRSKTLILALGFILDLLRNEET